MVSILEVYVTSNNLKYLASNNRVFFYLYRIKPYINETYFYTAACFGIGYSL